MPVKTEDLIRLKRNNARIVRRICNVRFEERISKDRKNLVKDS